MNSPKFGFYSFENSGVMSAPVMHEITLRAPVRGRFNCNEIDLPIQMASQSRPAVDQNI
ncbi:MULTISPECIES: hypothetical protein [Cohaesibacter]|uniref:hypothetical protein n=1 Tax=Cohaesibacter TaxID=655352 RepID=UPI0013002927|nr:MULTISPECIES: hypothetical protein [Cohaesibacter]